MSQYKITAEHYEERGGWMWRIRVSRTENDWQSQTAIRSEAHEIRWIGLLVAYFSVLSDRYHRRLLRRPVTIRLGRK